MNKKILTRESLVNKSGIFSVAIVGAFILGILILSMTQNGVNGNAIMGIIVLLIIFGGIIALMVRTNRQAKNGEFTIYVDTVIDKRCRRTGTREHRSTKYEIMFDRVGEIMPAFGGWTSVDNRTYHDIALEDKCYVVVIGTEKMYSTKVFPSSKYELSQDLQSKVQILDQVNKKGYGI